MAQRISVVIPAIDEEECIGTCVRRLLSISHVDECIVVDGQSVDATAHRAEAAGARVITSRPGRAHQQNVGAAHAKNPLLWFVHADSNPTDEAGRWICTTMDDPRVALGAFRFRLDRRTWPFRVLEAGVWLRSKLLRLPYGDQGFCVRRGDFEHWGGFEDVPVFEDVYLVRRARRAGRLKISPLPLITSARRWERHGVLRTTVIHLTMSLRERLGTPLDRLARSRGAR